MKNLKIKKALYTITALGLTSFALLTTGCSSKENNATVSNDTNTIENKEDNKEIFDNFESEKNEINELIYTGNFELAKEVWSEYFIDAIDMIFYDKEYKDTKWNDLAPNAKQEIINNLSEIDASITEIYPEYKEDWEKTKGLATDIYFEGLNKIKDLIGEDNYNAVKEIKDNIKSRASEVGNNIKNKANEWYQEFKTRNK